MSSSSSSWKDLNHLEKRLQWEKKRNEKSEKVLFRNFNTRTSNTLERTHIRCGGILFTKDLKAIVIVQNKYILNENNRELWGLPKGHIKNNETFAQCAQREIYEETGLILDVQDASPKLRINKTYYFPIVLNCTLDELMHKLKVIDVTEIADVCVLHIDKPSISKRNLNYELKLFLGHYLPRAKKIVDSLRKNKHDISICMK